MTAKLIQLIGLLVVVISTVVFFTLIVLYGDELTGAGSNDNAALGVAGSFLAGIAGIFVFVFGRGIAWWNRD